MRQIVCRFHDADAFLNHYESPRDTDVEAPSLSFEDDPGLPCGELIRVALIIDEPGERHNLHMRIDSRNPSLDHERAGLIWQYRATAVEEDGPWLQMLAEKYGTARRMTVDSPTSNTA